jgi:hypothetical protein
LYSIKTKGLALQRNYVTVSGPWEFLGSGPDGDHDCVEMWSCATTTPAALEALLDTDPTVLNYVSVIQPAT